MLAEAGLADMHQDLVRNIVSIHRSQDLFDDLSADPAAQALAQRVEAEVQPPAYRSATPVIHRPFEEAHWFDAIAWPFRHWRASRFSDGSFGAWYGSPAAETTVWETAYHWVHGLLADAGFMRDGVGIERKLYLVACDALLLDLRPLAGRHPALMHSSDYTACQQIGARLQREGHPGLLTRSVRHAGGENAAVFQAGVLSRPRALCQAAYRLEGGQVVVERGPGEKWLEMAVAGG